MIALMNSPLTLWYSVRSYDYYRNTYGKNRDYAVKLEFNFLESNFNHEIISNHEGPQCHSPWRSLVLNETLFHSISN